MSNSLMWKASAIVLSGFAGIGAYVAVAGPLNPPAGPVASTYKTLAEVEPRIAVNAVNTPGNATSTYIISQPGSYYLTSNVTAVAGDTCININSDNVTLDLCGFTVQGVAGSFRGISCTNKEYFIIRNGHVSGWGDSGIALGSGALRGGIVENITATDNVVNGIEVFSNTTIRHCVAGRNGNNGIVVGGNCVVSNCSAFENEVAGIDVGLGSVVSNCNASFNVGAGISAGSACLISECTAYSNDDDGIVVGTAGLIARCVVYQNSGDGIQVTSNCRVLENSCHTNGNGAADGAGIHALSIDNRIESNSCVFNDRGIDVDGTGNIIFRNTCSGNTTNWDVAASNVCNVLPATASGVPILGNNGGNAPGVNDPTANYTY